MKTAKGIQGIRKFLATRATGTGWHVFLMDEYVGYVENRTVAEIAADRGDAVLLHFVGNSITFDK